VETVLSSTPSKGASVAPGSTVTLNVSGGPTYQTPTPATTP
jgi:beta-lactam-binding protein with PASTA domain